MSYRWTPEGPAFDFPSPYLTENRLLVLRAWLLAICAVAVVAVVLLLVKGDADRPAVQLDELTEPPSMVPHLWAAAVLLLLAGLDWLQAHRRRSLVLVPGQPASLMSEIPREDSGQSPGVPGLLRVMGRGTAPSPALGGPYARWLAWMGPNLPAAPATLHAYLRLRFSHLLLGLALLLLLAGCTAVGLLTDRSAGLSVAAVLLSLVAMAVAMRHLLAPIKPALSPAIVGACVVLAALGAAAAMALSSRIPLAALLPRLGLPAAAAVMLAGGLLFEWLGVRAAHRHLRPPRAVQIPGAEATLSINGDPDQLMREVDMELHRRWTEGIPNRRYAWVTPQIARATQGGEFTALVLEESQPLTPADGSGVPAADVRGGLWWLSALAVAASAAGGLMWVALAVLQMTGSTSWVAGACGLACLAMGVHGMRLAHVLWSRIELHSTLTWLEFKGSFSRPAGASAAARVDDMRLHARVVQARSALYAAAPHHMGSRVLVAVADDPAASAQWTSLVADLARTVPATVAPRPPARPARVEPARGPAPGAAAPAPTPVRAAPQRPLARFCPACGTAVLNGARFCQHCGQVLPAE